MRRGCKAALWLLAAGCSSGAPSDAGTVFTGPPYVTATSDLGKLTVEVRIHDAAPSRGSFPAEITVKDAKSGAPQDGLVLDVVPWMPVHGHGTSTKPSVAPKGQGRYLLTDVNLFMPGHWELRTTFSTTPEDHASPALDVN